ncbi:hypothetical protein [Cerasicoccus arenae]|uniref:Uncharacterized protein n=1 Tax=Cerasicoccus arenae TaxID=424488 RepID=A0A8J3GFG5_9BACT|nr:hypothetical protein [Cerasicoccus arenae]MBK1859731.1 hypothetical protein [Cerasicoccus arenae]GHC06038.1 hypothetical protein GCM10007047_23810 [Cerasicoccus arenae]
MNAPLNAISKITARRSRHNPLITFNSSPTLGQNINGPTAIRVPSWLPNPLGKYYLYFGHHGGQFIRLAYADNPHGPWTIYDPGVLPVANVPAIFGHLASPDVHIDHEQRQLRMYFHGLVPGSKDQKTLLATSCDGINFTAGKDFLAWSYLRVFQWDGWLYGVDVYGNLYRSRHADSGWEMRAKKIVFPVMIQDKFGQRETSIRHCAMLLKGDTMILFYSRKQDAPERILATTVKLTNDWGEWLASTPIDVIQPEMDYEGSMYSNQPSVLGAGIGVRQLRDPCILEDEGLTYLYYSIAGEEGIALAELDIELR